MTVTINADLVRRRAMTWVHNHRSAKMLEVSTAQIPERTAEALGIDRQCESAPLWNVLAYEPWADYGWILWVTEHGTLPEAFLQQHPELAALLKFAEAEGFNYIKLDRDSDPLPRELGFPVFSW